MHNIRRENKQPKPVFCHSAIKKLMDIVRLTIIVSEKNCHIITLVTKDDFMGADLQNLKNPSNLFAPSKPWLDNENIPQTCQNR